MAPDQTPAARGTGIAVKVCILTGTYNPIVGGGEKQAEYLAQGLASNGVGVLVMTRQTSALHPRFEQAGSVAITRLPPSGRSRLSKWGLMVTSFLALLRLRSSYDLLFVAGFSLLGLPGVLACKLLEKPCVLKADSLGEFSGEYFLAGLPGSGFRPVRLLLQAGKLVRNWLYRKADAFVAISTPIEAEFTAQGIAPEKIHLIPNSVDLDRFTRPTPNEKRRLRRTLGLTEDGLIALYSGRLVSYKGLPLLVRVWADIVQSLPGVTLLLLGTGGLDIHNCEEELRDYVKDCSLEDSVTFLGVVEEVERYLQAADIFVFPSENEAFGVAMAEAMACELAVIGTSAGGLRDYLVHRENGLVVPIGDREALYRALKTLISDSSLRARLGTAAGKTVRDRFGAKIVEQQYLNLFHEIEGSDPADPRVKTAPSPTDHDRPRISNR